MASDDTSTVNKAKEIIHTPRDPTTIYADNLIWAAELGDNNANGVNGLALDTMTVTLS